MGLEIKGTIKQCLEIKSGVGKSSGKPWQLQTVVLTTDGQYPKDIAITLSGDKCGSLSVGSVVSMDIDISSREFKGNWYTTVRAYRINVENAPAQNPEPATSAPAPEPATGDPDKPDDDLPF